ncbi:hypothetical protein [Algoriphagus sp. A40]|uniref:hypothetical protein n=1 Tax=Algoriphagus sp. A40 TaxID=1945863 RepID=UPI001439016E|nr:hypothetical protein [Algoriphagus sp. A40]
MPITVTVPVEILISLSRLSFVVVASDIDPHVKLPAPTSIILVMLLAVPASTVTAPVTVKEKPPNVKELLFAPVAMVSAPILFAGDTFKVTVCPFWMVTIPGTAFCPGYPWPAVGTTQAVPLYLSHVFNTVQFCPVTLDL